MELLSYHSFACFNSHLDFLSAIPYPIKLDQLYSSKAALSVDEHLCTRKLQLWPFRHRSQLHNSDVERCLQCPNQQPPLWQLYLALLPDTASQVQ